MIESYPNDAIPCRDSLHVANTLDFPVVYDYSILMAPNKTSVGDETVRKRGRDRYARNLKDTLALRSNIPIDLVYLFDSIVNQAVSLHEQGRRQASGLRLRDAKMLEPSFAKKANERQRILGEARVEIKKSALTPFKVCTKCNKRRRRSSFHFQRAGLHGWEYQRSVCKKCALLLARDWKKNNPEQSEVHRKKAYKNSKERGYHLKANFGLTIEEFNALYARCDGNCQICKKPESRKRRLSLDHDHKTGRLRGFVCGRCNSLLGFALDDPELLRAAAEYLQAADLGVVITQGRSVPKQESYAAY